MSAEPEPKTQTVTSAIRRCWKCGALNVDGKSVRQDCKCDTPEWEDLVPLPLDVATIDPKTGWRNVYAERVLKRLVADVEYLRTLRADGAEEAARKTCEEYGHDARAGLCERCGGRVARAVE